VLFCRVSRRLNKGITAKCGTPCVYVIFARLHLCVPRRIAYTLRGAFVCESACGMLLGAQKSAGSCQTKRSISLLFIRSIAQRGNVTRIRYILPHRYSARWYGCFCAQNVLVCVWWCGGVWVCGCVACGNIMLLLPRINAGFYVVLACHILCSLVLSKIETCRD